MKDNFPTLRSLFSRGESDNLVIASISSGITGHAFSLFSRMLRIKVQSKFVSYLSLMVTINLHQRKKETISDFGIVIISSWLSWNSESKVRVIPGTCNEITAHVRIHVSFSICEINYSIIPFYEALVLHNCLLEAS